MIKMNREGIAKLVFSLYELMMKNELIGFKNLLLKNLEEEGLSGKV